MRLFEAIVAANSRAAAGRPEPADAISISSADLPIAVLSCIDARLNTMLPDALGVPESHLIWLRNAGNIITGPLSSTVRSLALACAIKGAKEVAIIGHTDCLVGKTTALQLLDRLAALGVDRQRLPANLVEYFGLFGTERQNILKAVEFVRASPLIGAKVPVHGLVLDVRSGRLEWIVNGYEGLASATVPAGPATHALRQADDALAAIGQIGNAALGELKFPATKIGEIVHTAQDWVHTAEKAAAVVEATLGQPAKAGTAKSAQPAKPGPLPPKLADVMQTLARRSPR